MPTKGSRKACEAREGWFVARWTPGTNPDLVNRPQTLPPPRPAARRRSGGRSAES